MLLRILGQIWGGIRNAVTLNFLRSSSLSDGYNFTGTSGDVLSPDISRNSIVTACVRWFQRTISEAPPLLQRWNAEAEEWEDVPRHRILDLLRRPNPSYPGTSLWKATVKDLVLTGNAYWIIVRNALGAPMQVWWAPAKMVTPKQAEDGMLGEIATYDVGNGTGRRTYRPEDVIHFRDGLRTDDPTLGDTGVGSLLGEVLVDERAAGFTRTLLDNAGQPGAVMGPQQGTIPQAAAEAIQNTWNEKFNSRSGAGQLMVTPAPMDIKQLSFTPQQMEMRAQRAIPEERTSAVIGVNAAVVGLGSGLATTKVGATLKEYREEAFESTIIPQYRDLQAHLDQQLLPQFGLDENWRMVFDLRGVRVLQEDELKKTERVCREVTDGIITVAEGRRMLGMPVLPEHEVYLRPANLRMIPTGAVAGPAEQEWQWKRQPPERAPGEPCGAGDRMKKFWDISAQGNEGEVSLYGVIEGDPGFMEGEVTPKQFVRELEALGRVDQLNIRINSPGGNVFAGQAIYSILRRHEARKVVTVDGLAASIASVVAMAGDEVVMPVNAMMMVHNPHGLSIGFADDHRKFADTLDKIRDGIVATYRDKTSLRRSQIEGFMDDETWFTAEEAVEQGFADRVDSRQVSASMRGELLVVNGLEMSLEGFRRRPPMQTMVAERGRAESTRNAEIELYARMQGGT